MSRRCKIVTKRMPWQGPGRQIKTVLVKERTEKPKCNCARMRGKHEKTPSCISSKPPDYWTK
jgi:hypothetical protein